jgi:hypothetical protein
MQPNKLTSSKRFLTAPLSAAVFVACAAGALASFGPPSLLATAWANPFTWDAPVRTIARFKAVEKDAGRSAPMPVINASDETVILDDWNYTAIVRGRSGPSHHF